MSNRAKAAAALASLGILGLGWGVATADGGTLTLNPTTDTTGTTTDTTAASGDPTATASASPSALASGSASASSSGYADGTYTGTTATHHYGSVTVTVTIENGAIASVSENVVSDGDSKSNQINNRAVPTLRSRVIAANGADVSTVSGATYTSRAYLTSLQSALDQAVA